MRILFFAPRDCRPPNTGSKLRNFHLCRELGREADVTYLSFEDGAPPHSDRMTERIVTVPHNGNSPLNVARGLVGQWPLTVLNYSTRAMQDALCRLLREERFDVIQMESLLMAPYLPALRALRPRPLLLCDWHNVDSEVLRRYAAHTANPARRAYALATARRMARLERQAMTWFDAHLTVSDRDRTHLLALHPKAQVFTVENGTDTAELEPSAASQYRILFVGSMDYHPNSDAALWFAREVWPQLHRARPDWVLTLVGRDPSPAVRALAELPNVEVTGTVADVRPFYCEALASVVPLRVGGGSRLKILEAMAARVPVVSTRIGAEGLAVQEGQTILLRDTPAEMARALLDLKRDETQRMTDAARDLVVSRYDWAAIGAGLREIHGQLLNRRGAETQREGREES